MIGWKHKYPGTTKYELKQAAKFPLVLNKDTDYSFDYIIREGLKLVRNKDNTSHFDNTVIILGNYLGKTFDKFKDASDNDCSFWEFTKIVSCRDVKMYLYTTKKVDEVKESSANLPAERMHKDTNVQKSDPTLNDKNASNTETSPLKHHREMNIKRPNIGPPTFTEFDDMDKSNNQKKSPAKKYRGLPKDCSESNATKPRASNENVLQFVQANVYGKDKIKILLPNCNTDYYESITSLKISVPVGRKEDFDDDLLLKELLGKGAFGQVMKGTWKGKPVAVKLMKI